MSLSLDHPHAPLGYVHNALTPSDFYEWVLILVKSPYYELDLDNTIIHAGMIVDLTNSSEADAKSSMSYTMVVIYKLTSSTV